MQAILITPKKSSGLFLQTLYLTVFFILLEISFFIQCARAYLFDFQFVSRNLQIPVAVLPDVARFMLAQLALHFMFCCMVWAVSLGIAQLFKLSNKNQLRLGLWLWVYAIIYILVLNQALYPTSAFADLTSLFLPSPLWAQWLCWILSGINIIGVSLAIYASLGCLSKRMWLLGVSVLAMFIVGWMALPPACSEIISSTTTTNTQPNVILIGIDSLRPDFLGFFGHTKPTPFIDTFLNRATVFAEAVTPLARTFPSWTAMLTGQYPLENGIRSNLGDQTHLNLSNTLPMLLRQHGYKTIFATDETRFSNIDKNYGFDQVITPPIGLNDFLLGTFNDFPLSNIVTNTFMGKWLFPHSYANRPVAVTYDPNSFLNLLRPVLNANQSPDKPVFLAVHFCLPHFPYLWDNLYVRHLNVLERYEASVQRVDQQVADFFQLLERNHFLDHAIVVMLSDHGEALEMNGDRITQQDLFVPSKAQPHMPQFYPPGLDKEAVNQSGGHGGDVLGLSQYHTLLAFRYYGLTPNKVTTLPGLVSLLDIKPTILAQLGLASTQASGVSLVSVINGQQSRVPPNRHLFLESDFSPEAIRTVYPEISKVLLVGIELFRIDPKTTRLIVKPTMQAKINASKQMADMYGEWMLAIYPQDKQMQMPILINLNTGLWTNDLQSALALNSPAKLMLEKLKHFYGSELSLPGM